MNANKEKIKKNIRTAQLADFKSHNRIVLSREPDKKISSTGDIDNVITLATEISLINFQYSPLVLLFDMTGEISNIFIIM